MDRAQKEQSVSALRQVFSEAGLIVVVHQTGLNAGEASELRRQMRRAGATYRVTKNRLARLALKETSAAGLVDLFEGPTAIACSQDPVAAAKVVVDYAKKSEKLKVLGGAMQEVMLDAPGVTALATLPTLDELRAKLIALLQAPSSRLARVLAAPASRLARLAAAYARGGIPGQSS